MRAGGHGKRERWAPVSCSILISTAYVPSQRIQAISPLLKGYNHALSHLQSKGHTQDPSMLNIANRAFQSLPNNCHPKPHYALPTTDQTLVIPKQSCILPPLYLCYFCSFCLEHPTFILLLAQLLPNPPGPRTSLNPPIYTTFPLTSRALTKMYVTGEWPYPHSVSPLDCKPFKSNCLMSRALHTVVLTLCLVC